MFTACGFPEGPRTTPDARAAKDGGIQAGIWVILIFFSNAFCSAPSVSGRPSPKVSDKLVADGVGLAQTRQTGRVHL